MGYVLIIRQSPLYLLDIRGKLFLQRLLSRLVYADRVMKDFTVEETRNGALGGKCT